MKTVRMRQGNNKGEEGTMWTEYLPLHCLTTEWGGSPAAFLEMEMDQILVLLLELNSLFFPNTFILLSHYRTLFF